jgi:hypothetical protein
MLPVAVVALAFSTSDAFAVHFQLARWDTLARQTNSLHAEYTVTESSGRRERSWDCSLRLLRTDDDVIGVLDMRERDALVKRFLLREGVITEIDPDRRAVTHYRPADSRRMVLDHLHPFLVALDRDRLAEAYTVRLLKRDADYSYLTFTPNCETSNWPAGVVVTAARKNDTLPVGVPRAVRHTHPDGSSVRYDVLRWDTSADGVASGLSVEVVGWRLCDGPAVWKFNCEHITGR